MKVSLTGISKARLAQLVVVIAPFPGLRHFIEAGKPVTLCGKAADGWDIDVAGGDMGCQVCARSAARPVKG